MQQRCRKESIQLNAFTADLITYQFEKKYDMVMSFGTLHFVQKADWKALINRAKANTNTGGIHIMQIFTDTVPASKDIAPFAIGLAKDKEIKELYNDWEILQFKSYTFEDEHPGVPKHLHASNKIVARKRFDMYKVELKSYTNYIQCIDESCCGAVYPRSIAERIQQGDIFTNSCGCNRSVLYWHYSGFAFLSGEYNECFLESVYDLLLDKSNTNPRRFILFVTDESVEQFFRAKKNTTIERRYFFEYRKECPVVTPILPAGYRLCEINNELLQKINGMITPAFSWNNANDFLEKGKGYCIVNGSDAVAWAFSSAISSAEIDIGIETNSEYRNQGFAAIVAEMMIRYCFNQHKKPVWACHSKNTASRKLAEKIGFVKTSECFTIQK